MHTWSTSHSPFMHPTSVEKLSAEDVAATVEIGHCAEHTCRLTPLLSFT